MKRSAPAASRNSRRLTGSRAGYRETNPPSQAGLSDRGQSFIRQQANSRSVFSTPQIERIRQTQAATDGVALAQYQETLASTSSLAPNHIDPSTGSYVPSHEGGEIQDAVSYSHNSASPAGIDDDDNWLTEPEDMDEP